MAQDFEPQELRYHVPVGQDSAAVLTHVRLSGLAATVEMAHGDEDIVISCDAVRARERVREVLESAPVDMNAHTRHGAPVVFADE